MANPYFNQRMTVYTKVNWPSISTTFALGGLSRARNYLENGHRVGELVGGAIHGL
jgi:hypothetical protein